MRGRMKGERRGNKDECSSGLMRDCKGKKKTQRLSLSVLIKVSSIALQLSDAFRDESHSLSQNPRLGKVSGPSTTTDAFIHSHLWSLQLN